MPKARELSLFKATAFGDVETANQTFMEETTVSLIKPKLQVTLSQPQKVNQTVTINVHMRNPLSYAPLTECKLISKETDVSSELSQALPNVPPSGEVRHSFTSKARHVGQGLLVVQLDCKELFDIRGHVGFDVQP